MTALSLAEAQAEIERLRARVAESRSVGEWVTMALRGEEVSDFAESFQIVRMAQDCRARALAAEAALVEERQARTAEVSAARAEGYARAREEGTPPPVCTGSGYPTDYFGRCGICQQEVMAPGGLCVTHPYLRASPAPTTTPRRFPERVPGESPTSHLGRVLDASGLKIGIAAPTPPVPTEGAATPWKLTCRHGVSSREICRDCYPHDPKEGP